jgi:hypothetical protein
MSENLSSIPSAVSSNPVSATDIKPVITPDTLCQDIHNLLDRIIRSMQGMTR